MTDSLNSFSSCKGGDDMEKKTKLITRPSIASKLMEAGFIGKKTVNPWEPAYSAWLFDATPDFMIALGKLDDRKVKQGGVADAR